MYYTPFVIAFYSQSSFSIITLVSLLFNLILLSEHQVIERTKYSSSSTIESSVIGIFSETLVDPARNVTEFDPEVS